MSDALEYDDFPVSSTILRERKDGALYITVPASEPDERALKAAKMHTALMATGRSLLFIVTIGVSFYALAPQLLRGLPLSAEALLLVFVGGVYLLAWQDLLGKRRDDLEAAWRRAAIIAIDEAGVLVQMDGRELSLPRKDLRRVTVVRERVWSNELARLRIVTGSETIELLEGRDIVELEWVRRRMSESEIPVEQGGEETPGKQA